MSDPYQDRRQTETKHFILKSYLQALAFKLLSGMDEFAYVDGFSGPWHSNTEDFSDTSFKIAIDVVRDAQEQILQRTGQLRTIRCFFVEKDVNSYQKLEAAVASYAIPGRRFHVRTFCGQFENAIPQIIEFVGRRAFTLVFIDPTGWSGYPLEKIGPLVRREPGEVLINFMYDFINRAVHMPDERTVASLDPILGGPGWKKRLDPSLPKGPEVEKLFRLELQKAGGFKYVTSTCIDKSTVDRPHFFITYGTRKDVGLLTFRETEYKALCDYELARSTAKVDKKEEARRQQQTETGQSSFFDTLDIQPHVPVDQLISELVVSNRLAAELFVVDILTRNEGSLPFPQVCIEVLQAFMLRETDVKDVCVALADQGVIEKTWRLRGDRKRKPDSPDTIRLM